MRAGLNALFFHRIVFLLWAAVLSTAAVCPAIEEPAVKRQWDTVAAADWPVAPQDWLQEKTGTYLPLDAEFTDEQGRRLTLAKLIDRPTLLLPVYSSVEKVKTPAFKAGSILLAAGLYWRAWNIAKEAIPNTRSNIILSG